MVSAAAAPAVVSAVAAAAVGGGGAVTGAVDRRYGPCKISLPVIKISKKKKKKVKKKRTEDLRHLRLESSIPIPRSGSDRRPSVLVILAVLWCMVELGGGRRKKEGSRAAMKGKST